MRTTVGSAMVVSAAVWMAGCYGPQLKTLDTRLRMAETKVEALQADLNTVALDCRVVKETICSTAEVCVARILNAHPNKAPQSPPYIVNNCQGDGTLGGERICCKKLIGNRSAERK